MAETKKKEEKKKPVKSSGKLKITKTNGGVIYRDNLEGIAESYKKKGFKVEDAKWVDIKHLQ